MVINETSVCTDIRWRLCYTGHVKNIRGREVFQDGTVIILPVDELI